MVDRSGIIFPQVDPEEWAQRYGIEMRELPCPECGSLFKLTVPIAMKGYRGFQAGYHGCENVEGCPFTVIPVGEMAKEWEVLTQALRDTGLLDCMN